MDPIASAAACAHGACNGIDRSLQALQGRILRSWPVPLLEAAGNVSSFRSAEFGLRKRTLRRELNRIVRALQSGSITPAQATDAFVTAYTTAAEQAYAIGIRKAGETFGAAGRAWVTDEVRGTASFFRGFADDIAADSVRFPGGVSGRLKLYTNRLDGVRSRGWADGNLEAGSFWWWRLSSSGEICDDCIVLNMSSPFRDEPPTVPGMGGTVCGCITTPGARVLTSRGLVPIADVKVGDRVLTHRNRFHRVLRTWKRRSRRESVFYFNNLGATANHHWLTADGWVETIDLHLRRLQVCRLGHEMPVQKEVVQELSRSAHLEREGRQHPQGYPRIWAPQTTTLRDAHMGLIQASVGLSRGTVLGRWGDIARDNASSLGLGEGQRSHPSGRGHPPHQRGQDGRSAGELGGDAPFSTWVASQSSWKGTGGWEYRTPDGRHHTAMERGDFDRSVCSRVSSRQGNDRSSPQGNRQGDSKTDLHPVAHGRDHLSVQEGRIIAQSLAQLQREQRSDQGSASRSRRVYQGTLEAGGYSFDLTVEEDASYIVEGLISHNSNCNCVLIKTERDFRESLTLRAVEDLVARARYLSASGDRRGAWEVGRKAIRAAEAAGYDPRRLADALFGDAGWRQHAASAATLRT